MNTIDETRSFFGDEQEDEDDEAQSSRRRCVDCSAWAPPTKTAHTLISSKHGWRLERISEARGHFRFDWRCPACWNLHKARAQKP
jgi:hypothetical protein